MKTTKALIAISVLILFFSCFDDSGQNDAKLILESLTSDENAQLHVAVYQSEITSKTLKSTGVYTPAQIVTVKVNPGVQLVFLLALTNEDGLITSIGVVGPVDVYFNHYPIQADLSDISFGLTHEYLPAPYLTWSYISGAYKYELMSSGVSGGPYSTVYTTFFNAYYTNLDDQYYVVRAYFDAFDLYSVNSSEIQHKLVY